MKIHPKTKRKQQQLLNKENEARYVAFHSSTLFPQNAKKILIFPFFLIVILICVSLYHIEVILNHFLFYLFIAYYLVLFKCYYCFILD